MTNNEIYNDDAMNTLLTETMQCVQEYLTTQNDNIENIVQKSADDINNCVVPAVIQNENNQVNTLNQEKNINNEYDSSDFDSSDTSDSDSEFLCNPESNDGKYGLSVISSSTKMAFVILLAGIIGYAVTRRR